MLLFYLFAMHKNSLWWIVYMLAEMRRSLCACWCLLYQCLHIVIQTKFTPNRFEFRYFCLFAFCMRDKYLFPLILFLKITTTTAAITTWAAVAASAATVEKSVRTCSVRQMYDYECECVCVCVQPSRYLPLVRLLCFDSLLFVQSIFFLPFHTEFDGLWRVPPVDWWYFTL